MAKNSTAFGRCVRRYRVAAGLSLRRVADELGVSHVYLGEVERGVRGPMKKERWKELTEAIPGLTLTELASAAAASKPVSIDLNNADSHYASLTHALARRVENQDLTPEEIKHLLDLLLKKEVKDG